MENSEPFWGQRALEAWPEYLSGTLLTLELTAISVVIGLVFAMPVAFMRLSKKPYVWMPTYGYMFFFRGTPLIVQIYLVYYGSGQFVQERGNVLGFHRLCLASFRGEMRLPFVLERSNLDGGGV